MSYDLPPGTAVLLAAEPEPEPTLPFCWFCETDLEALPHSTGLEGEACPRCQPGLFRGGDP